MDIPSLYQITRGRLLAVAADLGNDETTRPVTALPGWTVHDTYAHLAGVCADMLDGRVEGAGSPAWTALQVSSRSGRTLADIAAEWAERGPDFETFLDSGDPDRTAFPGFDIWNHEQDIRSTVGLVCDRDDNRVRFLSARALEVFGRRFTDDAVPPLRVVTDQGESVLGTGEPAATLHTTSYEFLRTVFGRRSQAQITAAGWEGDPATYVPHLSLFPLPESDLRD